MMAPSTKQPHAAWARFLFPLLAASCQVNKASFDWRMPSNLSTHVKRVSVLGVYRKGRLDDEPWRTLTEALAAEASAPCSPGYSGSARSENPDVFNAISMHVRLNGVAELPSLVMPAAEGDYILLFEMYGQLARAGLGHSGRPKGVGGARRVHCPGRHAVRPRTGRPRTGVRRHALFGSGTTRRDDPAHGL